MPILLPFSTNLVLAIFSAFSEICVVPVSRWISERFEGKQVLGELRDGRMVNVKRTEIGPLRLPIGRKSVAKTIFVVFLSLGIVTAITLAEYGVNPNQGVRDVVRRGYSPVTTKKRLYEEGVIKTSPGLYRSEQCIEVGKLQCQRDIGTGACIRTVYFPAVFANNKTECLDKKTGLLRQVSDVDVFSYENLRASIVSEGTPMKLVPDVRMIHAYKGTTKFEGKEFTSVFIRWLLWGGVNIFWNDSAIFLSLDGPWRADEEEDGIPVEVGLFPNGDNRPEHYIDSFVSMAARAVANVRMTVVKGFLFEIHYASSEIDTKPSEYTDSEFAATTEVGAISYGTLLVIFVVSTGIGLLSLGETSKIGTLNGLSKQYDDDKEGRGNSGAPTRFARIGIKRESGGSSQHIGSLIDCDSERRDDSIRLDDSNTADSVLFEEAEP